MFIPVWIAGAFLALILSSFLVAVRWAIKANATLEQQGRDISALTAILTANNLAVIADHDRQCSLQHGQHLEGHRRNGVRIDGLEGVLGAQSTEIAVLKAQSAANAAQIAAALAKLP